MAKAFTTHWEAARLEGHLQSLSSEEWWQWCLKMGQSKLKMRESRVAAHRDSYGTL